jgi:hypothetical protein
MSRFALAITAFLAANAAARADFTLQFNGVRSGSFSGDIHYSYSGADHLNHSGNINGVYFAEFSMTAVGQGAGGANLVFKTFCVDLFHKMIDSYVVHAMPLSTSPGTSGAPNPLPMGGWLGNSIGSLYNQYLGLTNPSTLQAAEYQLAIWRMTLGSGATLTTGNCVLDSGANSLYANALLHPNDSGFWLQKVNGDYGQSVLYPPPTGALATPAPGVVVLMSSGGLFFGLFGAMRRRVGG